MSQNQPGRDSSAMRHEQQFVKQTVLIAGDNVDHEAANDQEGRAEELKELIRLGQDEFFDVFEMAPRTV